VWESDGSGQPVELREREAPEAQDPLSQEGRLNGITSNDKTVPVVSAAFSPDNRFIVMAYNDNTARVWRTHSSEPPVVLRGHKDIVTSAAFSPDGHFIVTASRDKTARVWKADDSGQQLFVLRHEAHVLSAAFSPDGRSIVTASRDRTVRVWPVGVSQLRTLLLEANTDCLAPEPRQTYLDESDEAARNGFRECEYLNGRRPFSVRVP
jgi:WD40 repeat protein